MQRFNGNFQDDDGNALIGAQVYVYEHDESSPFSTLATIYSTYAGASQSNPLTVDATTAEFAFYTADGRYDIKAVLAGYPDGIWYDVQFFDRADAYAAIEGATQGIKYYWASAAERTAEAGMVADELGMMTNTATNRAAGVVGYVYQYISSTWTYVYTLLIDGSVLEYDLDMGGKQLIRSQTTQDQQIGPYAQGDGVAASMSAAYNPAGFDFSTNSFFIVFSVRSRSAAVGSSYYIIDLRAAAGFTVLQAVGSQKLQVLTENASGSASTYSDNALNDNKIHRVLVKFDRGADLTSIRIDGRLQAETNAIGAGTLTAGAALYVLSSAGSGYFPGSIFDIMFFNRLPINAEEETAFSANPQKAIDAEDEGASQTALTSGTLTIGRRYNIDAYVTGDDFTNVGAASNATGIEFIATGTTPTTWTNSSSLRHTGCVANWKSLDLVDGTVWKDSSGNGNHLVNSGAEILNKTSQVTPKEGTWTPANGDFGTWTSPTFTAKYKKMAGQATISLEQTGGTIDPGAAGKYITGVPYTPSNIATGQASSAVFSDHGAIFLKADGKIYFSDDFGPVTDLAFSITYPTDA